MDTLIEIITFSVSLVDTIDINDAEKIVRRTNLWSIYYLAYVQFNVLSDDSAITMVYSNAGRHDCRPF